MENPRFQLNPRLASALAAVALSLIGAAAIAAKPAAPVLFETSDRCQACHNGLVAPEGTDLSIGSDWRASMMANAGRDPYWQASVRRETLDHPALTAAIEDKCSTCHMPMARTTDRAAGGTGQVFAHLQPAAVATPAAILAVDGVSCSACHQIMPEGLGEESSFTGGFVVDATAPAGARTVYGPFEVDAGRTRAMRSSSGFAPAKADHLAGAELCATCHTLYTHAYDASGAEVGLLAEQVPYQEWLHSAFRERKPCQDCHMPVHGAPAPITGVLPQQREAFSRHVFRGGNFFLPRVFTAYSADLGVRAQPVELGAMIARTEDHLRTKAAALALTAIPAGGRTVEIAVEVTNLAGHKLPTAYPSRRAWIHLAVRDAAGKAVFESGAPRPDGSIEGNDNDADGTKYEPHHLVITSADQVQIYEPILGAPDGSVTTGLLTGSRYLKDNRIPPEGFDKATAHEHVAVLGAAREDPDFEAGRDRILYRVEVGEAAGPFTVEAVLRYQPVGYRWAHNLGLKPSVEGERFVRYYDALAEGSTIALTRAEARVDCAE